MGFFKLLWKVLRLWFGKKKSGVFYINGPDTLPEPLSQEEEARLLSLLPGDPAARSSLVEHNLRLVVYIAKRFESGYCGVEDLISIGTIGLIKAINTFNAEKNIKLATYASRCIENEILMVLRKNQNRKGDVSLDEPLNTDGEGNELLLSDILGIDDEVIYRDIETEEEKKIVRRAVESLEERERRIIELRFGLNGNPEKTQKEVADLLGISQSYISRLEKKILDKLKEEIGVVF